MSEADEGPWIILISAVIVAVSIGYYQKPRAKDNHVSEDYE
jgi:hypothetical protein